MDRNIRGLVAVVSALATVALPSVARAAVVEDGETFSVDLSEARVCFVRPEALRRDEDCAGLDLSKVVVPSSARGEVIGTGLIRVPGSESSPRLLGVVQVVRTNLKNPIPWTELDAKKMGDGFVKEFETHQRPGTRVAHASSRIVQAGDLSIARLTVSIAGLPAGTPLEMTGHVESVFVPAVEHSYMIQVLGAPQNAEALARFIDAAAPTVKLSREATPRPNAGEVLGRTVYWVYTGLVFAVITIGGFVAAMRWRKREALALELARRSAEMAAPRRRKKRTPSSRSPESEGQDS